MNVRRSCLVLLLLGACAATAQVPHPVRETRDRNSAINIVFLAEGYTSDEQSKFEADAATKTAAMLADESWARFAEYVNAFAIYVASAESGADEPSLNIVRDTYFNASFGTNGIDRLLTIASGASGTLKAYELLTQFVPDYDLAIVLVNSPKYGGAGGAIVVTSMATQSNEILLHEVGHNFAKLTDEYVDTANAHRYPPREYPNATQHAERATIPWRHFIDPATPVPTSTADDENVVGLFEGAHYRATGFYRPTFNSKMRSLNRPFGPVNLRAFAAGVHALALENATAGPSIVAAPQSAIVADGASHTLAVTVAGTGPFTYQWARDGVWLPGATGSSLEIAALGALHKGDYTVEIANSAGETMSTAATITPLSQAVPVAVSGLPASISVFYGERLVLTPTVLGTPPLSYQWHKGGLEIPGATGATLVIDPASDADAGSYTLRIGNGVTTAVSSPATVSLATPGDARVVNLSIRAVVGKSGNALTVGFTIGGAGGSGGKPLLIRGIGPSLAAFGVPSPLGDPRITLYSDRVLDENDDWGGNATVKAVGVQVGAFGLPNDSSADAAMYQPGMAAGSYTVRVTAPAATSGVALAEIYDASPGAAATARRLINVSALTHSGGGEESLTAGFVVIGSGGKRLLVRAVGPALGGDPFNVPDVLPDPKLKLFRTEGNLSTLMGENDNWGGDTALSAAFAKTGAFPLDPAAKDSALLAVLPAGNYSAQVSGGAGTVLIEVYEVP